VYFSDDSCYACRTPSGVWRVNLDISSCDASHSERLFTKFTELHPRGHARNDIRVLVDQCRAPIKITAPSPINGKRIRVRLRSKQVRLYSGSTLTTVINGFANACIAQAIHSANAQSVEDITTAAQAVGYIVTSEECAEFEDIQFLKSSPVQDTEGRYRPLLNFGVLLRAFGTCKGDLPGRGDLKARGDAFQKALLRGLYPYASFPLLDKIKSRYEHAKELSLPSNHIADLAFKCTDTNATFTDDAVFRRYFRDGVSGVRMSADDLCGLEELAELPFGWEHASHGADSILHRDYGLRCWT